MNAANYTPERLADRAQIQDVMYRWCRGVDRRDFELARSAFHADATDNHGQYNGGVDGLVQWLQHRHRTISMSMHLCANMKIEFGGPDVAVVETYCIAAQRYSAATAEGRAVLAAMAGGQERAGTGDTDMMAFARYVDRFERREGEWRIARRAVVHERVAMDDVAPDAPGFGADWVVRSRDRDDYLYGVRAAAGVGD